MRKVELQERLGTGPPTLRLPQSVNKDAHAVREEMTLFGGGVARSSNGFVVPECLDGDLLEEQSLDGEPPHAAYARVFAEGSVVWSARVGFEIEGFKDHV